MVSRNREGAWIVSDFVTDSFFGGPPWLKTMRFYDYTRTEATDMFAEAVTDEGLVTVEVD